eukprot:2544518-Rhodomonas_salina.1
MPAFPLLAALPEYQQQRIWLTERDPLASVARALVQTHDCGPIERKHARAFFRNERCHLPRCHSARCVSVGDACRAPNVEHRMTGVPVRGTFRACGGAGTVCVSGRCASAPVAAAGVSVVALALGLRGGAMKSSSLSSSASLVAVVASASVAPSVSALASVETAPVSVSSSGSLVVVEASASVAHSASAIASRATSLASSPADSSPSASSPSRLYVRPGTSPSSASESDSCSPPCPPAATPSHARTSSPAVAPPSSQAAPSSPCSGWHVHSSRLHQQIPSSSSSPPPLIAL